VDTHLEAEEHDMKITIVNGVECELLHINDPLTHGISELAEDLNGASDAGRCSLCPACSGEGYPASCAATDCGPDFFVPVELVPLLKLRSPS
jgi:hypothetical protein